MTRRYLVNDEPSVHALLAQLGVDLGPLPVLNNIAPTDQVPVIHEWEGTRLISDMRWWLVPHWSGGPSTEYPMFNASVERLSESRAWDGCFAHKRAVLPARAFFLWRDVNGARTPFMIDCAAGAFAFAGLWDYWTDSIQHVLSAAIVTVPADTRLAAFSTRMPAILDVEAAQAWLDPATSQQALYALLARPLASELYATPLDPRINHQADKQAPLPVGERRLLC